MPGKMHPDEQYTDVRLVKRLLSTQFPQWADLPIKRVASAGTDNALYRLGESMVVRLPRTQGAMEQVEKEQKWLPKLAQILPLDIPVPLAVGRPGEGYPWDWSITSWLGGENATLERIADPAQAAADLAKFITALRQIDITGGPPPGRHNFWRGAPLAQREAMTRTAMRALDGVIDIEAATALWQAALETPAWLKAPVWIHGDLHSGNLLAVNGRLSAVIDFGGLGVGDPAYDVMAAWLYLPAETRVLFREALQVDDDTWTRARSLALSVGVVALPYYQDTNPVLAAISRRAIEETIADFNHVT